MSNSSAYSPIDGLLDLACRDGVEIRPTLLRVLTDLYVQKHSHTAEEEAQYVELALRLIETVDLGTRKAVAASLSKYANAPVPVLRRLIELSGEDVTPAQAEPPAAVETEREPDLIETFFAASPSERKLILTNLAVVGEPVPRRASAAASEVIRRLEAAAMQRNAGEFARILERALGITRAIAERAARDASGEPLVVAAKALNVPAAVFQRILLCLNPAIGHSVERVFELSSLHEEIQPSAAERMVAIWRAASPHPSAKPAAHAPALADTDTRSARAAATPSRTRVPVRETAPPRYRGRES
jgi:hypothetical protein